LDHAGFEWPTQLAHRIIEVLDEDFGLVAEIAQHFADERRLIRDGVAIREVGEELVDGPEATSAGQSVYPRVCRTELERFFIAIDRLVPIGMLQRVGASALADHLQLGSRLPFEFQEPLRPLNLGSRRPTAARRLDRDTGRQALARYKHRAYAKPSFHAAPRVALVAW